MLLHAGLRINVQSADGRTPLHMTAIHGRFTRSKSLLDAGAMPDINDKNGNTALHIAAWYEKRFFFKICLNWFFIDNCTHTLTFNFQFNYIKL